MTFRAFTSVSAKFSSILQEKNIPFLFYTPTFTKHPHQFIYSTHLFNKIFISLTLFIYSQNPLIRPEHWAQQINSTDQPSYHRSTLIENQSATIVPLPLQIQPSMNLNETSKSLLDNLLTTTNQEDPITILSVSKKLQLSSYSQTLASFAFFALKIQDLSHRSAWNGRGARGA